jgi:hypothetical protein
LGYLEPHPIEFQTIHPSEAALIAMKLLLSLPILAIASILIYGKREFRLEGMPANFYISYTPPICAALF